MDVDTQTRTPSGLLGEVPSAPWRRLGGETVALMMPTIGRRPARGCIVIHRGDQAAAAVTRLLRPYLPSDATEPGDDDALLLRRVLAGLRGLPDE